MSELKVVPTTGLFNADCLDILKEMPDESVDCIVTDCPYTIVQGGVSKHVSEYEPSGCLDKRRLYSQTGSDIKDVRAGKLFKYNDIQFDEWLPDCYRVLKDGTHCYIMISPRRLKDLQIACEKAGFEYQNTLVWDKQNAVLNKYYMNAYELILMLRKGSARNINNLGDTNLLKVPIVKGREHPTQKPVALMEILIGNSTNKGDVVLDPFMGSGTTCIAADRLGRQYVGIEKDERYFKVAQERMKEETAQLRFELGGLE